MKKFTINCDFGGQLAPFTIYIGKPEPGHHALHFQADWLSKQRGGMIPGEVMEAVTQLQELAVKNGVSLEELCVYALGTEEEQAALSAQNGEELTESISTDDENMQVPQSADEETMDELQVRQESDQGIDQEIDDSSLDEEDDTEVKKPKK